MESTCHWFGLEPGGQAEGLAPVLVNEVLAVALSLQQALSGLFEYSARKRAGGA